MTLKESMQKNIEAHANFVRNRDYEGGAEYFNKELLEHKQFEAAIYHAFFQIWLVYREDRTFDVKAFEETIETAFKLYPLSVERAIINEPDFQEENVSDVKSFEDKNVDLSKDSTVLPAKNIKVNYAGGAYVKYLYILVLNIYHTNMIKIKLFIL